MFNRPQKHRRTCWSIVANLLSEASPSKLLLGYLYASGQFLGNFANAQNVVTETYYYGVEGGKSIEPSSVCINAAPGHMLSARGIFSHGKDLVSFNVEQQPCGSAIDSMWRKSTLADQLRSRTFIGDKLCNKTVTNTAKFQNPLSSCTLTETDYSVKLDEIDRVELTYRRH